jgi:hypothetical protein
MTGTAARNAMSMAAIVRFSAVALLVLTGCAGQPVFNVDYDLSYVPGETQAAGPDLTVVIRGNPSDLPKPVFDRAVTDAMHGWGFALNHFTTEGDPNSPYRVVIVFNPPPTAGGYVLCQRPLTVDAVAQGVQSARVPVVAALCRGDSYIALADGSIGAAGGPLGPDFRNGIGLMTASLFPAQNPQRRGGPDCALC